MGKYEQKRKKKQRKNLVAAALLTVVALATALFLMPQVLYRLNGEAEYSENVSGLPDNSDVNEATVSTTPAGSEDSSPMTSQEPLEFPLALENGKLDIESIFQFDGINPDCGNQEGKNIATATVTNLSDMYLESAELSVTTDSSDVLRFVITDLPAGKTALVFSAENASVKETTAYADVVCKPVFNPEASMNEDKVTATVEGTKVTLKNNTSEEIANIVVYCHASLGDQFFGGITYTYPVNNLPANGTAEVDAAECFLGLAEVVRIAINES